MIRVLFFGRLSDRAGIEPWRLPAEGIATVADLIARVAARDPALGRELAAPEVLVAVNQRVVSRSAKVAAGDEVAFLPPVTGG
ncbi:MAG: molybdopterin synthase sulfur carrier subunit [Porticoccaceae bacterium]|nr:MAG: molybdopterin synthase sulfur carrier subunit [Porticoccaceae bacterium]